MARPSRRVALSLATASTAAGATLIALALSGAPGRTLCYALAAYLAVASATLAYLLATMPRAGCG